jgi:hypothetical protein
MTNGQLSIAVMPELYTVIILDLYVEAKYLSNLVRQHERQREGPTKHSFLRRNLLISYGLEGMPRDVTNNRGSHMVLVTTEKGAGTYRRAQ